MIDPDSNRAPHRQIADVLRDRIASGELAPGTKLPSEEDLGREHGVHRSTARRAMSTLRAEGLVEVRHSAGTFVREALAVQAIDLASGAVVTTRMPTPQERRQLGVAEGVPVFVVEHDGTTTLYASDRCELWTGPPGEELDGVRVSGTCDPGRLIDAVLTWLDQQPGVSPNLRLTEVHNAEAAAAELLRCLDVEPGARERRNE